MNRITINFHGLGPLPAHVGAGEARVWCTDPALYADLLDEVRTEAEAHDLDYLITFDDGNLSDIEIGLKPLVDRHMAAIIFPCAGRIGEKNYLDQGALRELVAAGMEIGSHGWSHVDWRQTSPETTKQEIGEAKNRIEQAAGAAVTTVAIPFGRYNRRVLRNAELFETIYTSDAALADASARLQPRFSYTNDWRRGSVGAAIAEAKRPLKRLRQSLAITYKSWR